MLISSNIVEYWSLRLGRAATALLVCAEYRWLDPDLDASGIDQPPPTFDNDRGEILTALSTLSEHFPSGDFQNHVQCVTVALDSAMARWATDWLNDEHEHAVGLLSRAEPECISDDWLEGLSPLSWPEWKRFRETMRDLGGALPDGCSLCMRIGTCVSQILMRDRGEQPERFGERFPAQVLRDSLLKLHDLHPCRHDLDFDNPAGPADAQEWRPEEILNDDERVAALYQQVLSRFSGLQSKTSSNSATADENGGAQLLPNSRAEGELQGGNSDRGAGAMEGASGIRVNGVLRTTQQDHGQDKQNQASSSDNGSKRQHRSSPWETLYTLHDEMRKEPDCSDAKIAKAYMTKYPKRHNQVTVKQLVRTLRNYRCRHQRALGTPPREGTHNGAD